MGLLVEGQWTDCWYDTSSTGGRFVRKDASFRRWVEADPTAEFPGLAGRYHLYVANACPWAHRTMIARALKGLTDAVSVTVVHPDMLERGWELKEGHQDALLGKRHLYEVYQEADAGYTGRVTVPVLWDKTKNTIVNNESSEIIRMFNSAFPDATGPDLCPEAHRAEIDEVNERVYHTLNNGVYKCGFATTQEAYEEAVEPLFETLEWLEARLDGRSYLVGDQLTEADVRLFTTLIRFDPVYHFHFKCTRKRIRDYPRLWDFTRRLYALPGVADTVVMDEIRRHYFYSHDSINPHRVVPVMPAMDL